MREMLFKAKSYGNEEWVFGHVFWRMYDDIETCCIADEPICGNDYSEIIGCYMVDSETVCQYTGVMDNNKNRIFENDKIKFKKWLTGEEYWVGIVIFEQGAFFVKGTSNQEEHEDILFPLGSILNENIEVIGNFYD